MRKLSNCVLAVVLIFMTVVSVCRGFVAGAAEVHSVQKIDYRQFVKDNSKRPLSELSRDAHRCRQNGFIDSAAAFYSTAAGLYSESLPERDIRRCAIAAVNLGYIFLGWEMDPTAAYPWLMRADSIAKKHGFDDIRTSVKSNLGRMYLDYNNYKKAAEYLRQTLAEVMAQKTDGYFAMSLIDFTASALFGQDHMLKGKFAGEVIGYKVKDGIPLARYARALQRAIGRYKLGDPAGAARIMTESRDFIDIDSERDLYYVMHAIITGKFLMASGNYKEAAAILKEETASAKAEGYYNLLEKCYSMLIECARYLGDTEGAERYRFKALEIRDSLFNAVRFEAIKDIEKSIAIDEVREEGKAADEHARHKLIIYIILSCVLLSLALILIGWRYRGRLTTHKGTKKDKSAGGTPAADCVESGEMSRQLLDRITAFMEESESVFSPDFSVESLAEAIGSRPKAVSQAINQIAGMNFNTFVGAVRVKKACTILTDPQKMKTLTIESVAESVGYRSRTYFSKVFKDITGLTPSQFARKASHDSADNG